MNYLNNPVQNIADVTALATYNNVFPKIKYWQRNFEATKHFTVNQYKEMGNFTYETHPEFFCEKERNPTTNDFSIIAFFPQMWGSTALGFGGVGGAAMTEAYTTVIKFNDYYAVFFGNSFAYTIHEPNISFFNDIKEMHMKPVKNSNTYI